eukprot:CAMPEP_0172727708 /NCGR_PEP_ID=MMETSP1074-20121228/91828_1 /TAXON_ID=2916 /ORGANISM="Ceratium fusus, Strain PA161109" /LENGTH=836 /DNA_ID=CAMNT_0013554881 /DNA_START=90 /DNA_END=2600 /DNA_ORIENTATION=+
MAAEEDVELDELEVEVEEAEEELDVDIEDAVEDDETARGESSKVPLEEMERDEPPCKGASGIKHTVAFSDMEATPDVFSSGDGTVVSSLQQHGFQHLLSAVRADTGIKAGRYLIELRILEAPLGAAQELRFGLSTAGSSLFLGDGSAENVCFNSEGDYIATDPWQTSPFVHAKACKRIQSGQVIGMLVNLNSGSANANTVSVFLDGERAGPPQPFPSHLRGKVLFPTLAFRNLTLVVNFGARKTGQLRALPFTCRMFADMLEFDSSRLEPSTAPREVREIVIPVGLPGEGLFDFASKFLEKHPHFNELSERKIAEWCHKSGLRSKAKLSKGHSRDRPDFAFDQPELHDRQMLRDAVLQRAHLRGTSCLALELSAGLLRSERQALLRQFPKACKKVAIVAIGEPSDAFKQWVRKRIKSEHETKVAIVQKRKDIAEASGEDLAPEDMELPPEPVIDKNTWLLPREDDVPDVSEETLGQHYVNYTLPGLDEGFDEVIYEWLPEKEATEHLRKWVLDRKTNLIIENLQPGSWFQSRLEDWHNLRKELRQNHQSYGKQKKIIEEAGGEVDEPIDLSEVESIHDADGSGAPIYGDFKYEDWMLLAWRLELHLLVHAFVQDCGDLDCPGMPAKHVAHYYQLYYKSSYNPQARLGKDNLPEIVKLLKGPLELHEHQGKVTVLRSTLEKDTPLKDFVMGVEKYRRDRGRRIGAGDESARLNFPRPVAKAKGGKSAPPVVIVKRPLQPDVGDEKAAKRLRPEATMASVAKSPAVKPPAAKPAGLAKAPVAKEPAAKAPLPKTPGAKVPTAKVAVGKTAPGPKAPGTKAPVAKTPLVKTYQKRNIEA